MQLLELYLILAQIITSAPAKPAPKEKKELKVERPYVWHNVILLKKAGSDGNAIWPCKYHDAVYEYFLQA